MKRTVAARARGLAVGVTSALLVLGGISVARAGVDLWTTNGPTDGAIRALALDATAPLKVYAGTAGGSIFRTTDGGAAWQLVSLPFAGVSPGVFVIVPAPQLPTTLFAGTSDGVFKTTDAGGTWKATRLSGLSTYALAIDPKRTSTLYAGTSEDTVYKSTDDGGTWGALDTLQRSRSVRGLAIDVGTRTTVYAATDKGRVFASTNGGAAWVPTGATGIDVTELRGLAIAPTVPPALFAASDVGVFRSTNAGASWQGASAGLASKNVTALTIDPNTATSLYVWSDGLYKSTNSGTTWTAAGLAGSGSAVVIDPVAPGTMYAGGSSLFKTTDAGASWHPVNHGLSDTSISSLAVDSTAAVYAGGTQVFRSTDRGASWAALAADLPSFVPAVAVDPSNPSTQYAGTSLGVFRSTDGGATWKSVGTRRDVTTLAIDTATPTTLYAGTADKGVFKSTDRGTRWTSANDDLTRDTFVNAITVDPVDSAVVYLGTQRSAAGSAFKTTDAGLTWHPLDVSPPGSPRVDVAALVVHPRAPAVLYAGTSGGLVQSSDGGASWNATGLVEGGVAALAIDPMTPATLYAGTANAGVFKSTNAGSTWDPLNTGLTTQSINALALDPDRSSIVYAGTAGGGVFAIEQIGHCRGDCNDNQQVTIDEVLTMVGITLGGIAASECPNGDADGDGQISVDEILTAVRHALEACPTPITTAQLATAAPAPSA